MQDHTPLGRRIIVKTKRKGSGLYRNKHTGKRAEFFVRDSQGHETLHCRVSAPNFKHLQKKLRSTGLVPTYVIIKKRGETRF